MDDEFWLKIYRDWSREQLEKEIGSCHLYQQDLIYKVGSRNIQPDTAVRLMITSQCREYIIRQVLAEKGQSK